MTWQPIETAPKDGTLIIIAYTIRNVPGEPDLTDADCARWADYRDGTGRVVAGTWEGLDSVVYPSATHWMPLPDPPETGQ